jgi:hypothetical protein
LKQEQCPHALEAADFWGTRYKQELTEEDRRQIIENVSGFFAALERWAESTPCDPGRGEQ